MSNSVVKVTELPSNDSLFLLKGRDGIIMPDKETVESYLGSRKQETEINLICINESYGNSIEATMEPLIYDPNNTEDMLEEIIASNSSDMEDHESNLEQNLLYFRLDHDYTPIGSPKQSSPVAAPDEADELAQTLSMLEGCHTESPPPPILQPQVDSQPEVAYKIVKPAPKVAKLSPAPPPLQPVSKAKIKRVVPEKKLPTLSAGPKQQQQQLQQQQQQQLQQQQQTAKLPKRIPKPKPPEQPSKVESVDDEEEEDDEDFALESEESDEDDENDSDFELQETQKSKPTRRVLRGRKKKDSVDLSTETDKQKGRRTPKAKAATSKQVQQQNQQQLQQPKSEPEQLKPPEKPSEQPAEQKIPEKKPPKKEKKIPKPIPDDFALFSTPDIIRRVGGKQENTPTTPVTPTPESSKTAANMPKPAKISPESRTKSTSERTSIDGKVKRPSTDTKTSPNEKDKTASVKPKNSLDEKNKERRMSADNKTSNNSNTNVNRRPSLNLDLKKAPTQNSSVKTPPKVNINLPSKTNHTIVQQPEEAMRNNSNEIAPLPHPETMPVVEEIRAMIQNENTKTYTNSLEMPNAEQPPPVQQSSMDQNPMNLDTGGLDIDPLLDNINSDLISEDILYQVAQSLADNTELQNAIDKSLNDGNLVLDPAVQQAISQNQNIMHHESLQQKQVNMPKTESPSPTKGTQIVRPDGRVVIIPPIERPTTRSRNRKPQVAEPLKIAPKPVHKPLDDDHVSGNELDSSEEDDEEDDRSDDDPEKLWCICNQPHNNRFMICCDSCEEWYHGKCVNVTKAMGQLMEQEGREWICVYCKDPSLKRPAAAARRVRKASRASTDSGKSQSKSSTSLTETSSSSYTPDCIVCGKPSRSNSIFCSDQCILKQAQNVERVVVFERATGKILSGNNAPSAANLEKWLLDHPGFEVVRSTSKPVASKALSQSKLKIIKNTASDGVSLAVQKKGLNIGILHHSPKGTQQIQTPNKTPAKQLPHFKIIRKHKPLNEPRTKLIQAPPMTVTVTATPVKTKTTQSTPKTPTNTTPKTPTTPTPVQKEKAKPQKTPKSKPDDQTPPQPKQSENIRENVKKTVCEQLMNRLKMADDIKVDQEEVAKISDEIELQLYKCFGDTGQKYRNKYRSLIFNIKDVKNQTLWRRICEKSVNPYQLVRLSPEDLASQELALWRERENKHQLDMIKKSELELLSCNRQYVLKTHKGEQILEDNRPKDGIDSTEVIATLNTDNSNATENADSKKDSKDKDKKGSKHAKHDKERDRDRSHSRRSNKEKSDSKERRKEEKSKEHKRRSKSRSRSRSRSRDRNSRHNEKKKSSRDRDRHHRSSHKSSRHKKESSTTEKLDKKSKEILEQLVDKQIVPPLEDRLWKHVPQDDITTPALAESDSDHEPSSTVTIPTPPRNSEAEGSPTLPTSYLDKSDKVDGDILTKVDSPILNDDGSRSPPPRITNDYIWKGTINMVDVAQISITAHEVSGDCAGLGEELPPALDVVGRISPETVWEYIGKMKCSNSKAISLIRLNATNMEEKMPYIALYSYLSSRNRLGVIKSLNKAVKDFYILPLASQKPIPQALLPISGPGFEESRPALLLGIIVRDKRKRPIFDPMPVVPKRTKIEVSVVVTPPAPATITTAAPRSYTPPPINRDPRIKTPYTPAPPSVPLVEEEKETADDMDEPYSPEDSDPDTTAAPTPVIPTPLIDTSNLMPTTVTKPATYLEAAPPVQTFEPFSNKFDTIPGLEETTTLPASSQELQKKMAELDQKIALQKAEIDNMSQNIVSTASTDIGSSTLANIALPSNLQQILDSIKGIGAATTNQETTPVTSVKDTTPSKASDLTIPLILPKINSRPLTAPAANVPSSKIDLPSMSSPTIPLNLPKPKIKPPSLNSPLLDKSMALKAEAEKEKSGSVLSSLSEEDLIRKAAEMLGESSETKPKSQKASVSTPSEGFTPKPGYQTRVPPPYASGPVMYTPPPNIVAAVPPNLSVPPPNVLPPKNIPPPNMIPPVKRSKVDDQPPVPGLEDEM